ncbi:site-specific integrase (plasmid) [Lactiplantibacillus pentosus]|uniref:site-specific integrase n=1 Tax=Lactiplantibacillus pentosus TaxID=1589 RepID=UPI0034D62DDC
MQQVVLPIKDSNVLKEVQDTLLNNFKAGRRNYTVFQVGKATLLRVSDVMRLKQTDIFNPDGSINKMRLFMTEKLVNLIPCTLKPVQTELLLYRQWLLDHKLDSEWLFPSIQHPERHITEKQFYKIMSKVGDLLGINYLGTHTMRKTGAYRVYTQSNYNIGLVMHLLNHSSESMTLAYLGLDQASTENMLNQIDFG